jgi:hypothetical protein
MSLAIDVDRVAAVLLADGWHTVSNDSFELDAYEYLQHDDEDVGTPGGQRQTIMRLGGGQEPWCRPRVLPGPRAGRSSSVR